MEELQDQFRCQYYQLIPAKRFHLVAKHDEELLHDPAFQEFLVDILLYESLLPVSETYRQSILKLCIRALERQHVELDERILEAYAISIARPSAIERPETTVQNGKSTLFPSPRPGDSVLVRYFYEADNYFGIHESPSILAAEGTTGHKTWEAALALGDHLLANTSMVQHKVILELGAGTGFLSILASRLGANKVAATDGSEKMVDLMRLNVEENEEHNIECTKLWFGSKNAILEDKFDLVLGADVTYDESILDPLCGTISDLLRSNPSALVLIAATVRREKTYDCPKMPEDADILDCMLSSSAAQNTT